MFVNSLFWFDNDFEIESKYHRKIAVLSLKARILSLQDVVFRIMFFLMFIKLSAGNGFFIKHFSC